MRCGARGSSGRAAAGAWHAGAGEGTRGATATADYYGCYRCGYG